MSWTRSVPPERASEPIRSLYEKIRARSGGQVSELWQTLAPDPPALEGIFALVRDLLDHPAPLTPAQAEAIMVVVSTTNGCGYCVSHHGPRLAAALGDEALARAVARDYREANLPARDRVLLDHAVALTCEPGERTEDDVERLRDYGFDDAAILRATAIAALVNLIDRLATPLGVALEPGFQPWEFGAQK